MSTRREVSLPPFVLLSAGCGLLLLGLLLASPLLAQAPNVKDDPLVRMPGSQPAPEGSVSLEDPTRCFNCHAGYNTAVEPGFGWKGSMMAHAMRDPLFFACLTVAAQDALWATGSTNGTDICLRCHSPKGWLEGRSDPTNGSALTGADWDGVQCDVCHRMIAPHPVVTADGADWWDETNASSTPSDPAAEGTYAADLSELSLLRLFNGRPSYSGAVPEQGGYQEATSGQYVVATDAAKRASFADAAARHQMHYSRFHKSQAFCGTCHDVSNPILANLGAGGVKGDGSSVLPTEAQSAHAYFHVERTFSEYMLSAYAQPGGAPGKGPFAPDRFDTSAPGNAITRCQDCHLRDVVGEGANKRGAPIRPNQSLEHPNSGLPLHDMTGGNVWVSEILASTVPGSPGYDATNAQLLGQGPAALTLDLTQGQGIDAVALLAGAARARQQLGLAAAIEDLAYDPTTGALSFKVSNQAGHKLISGFPEGRRMFVSIVAWSGGVEIYAANPYDTAAATLKGLPGATYDPDLIAPTPLAAHEEYLDELVYEAHPASSITGESETFHFALADGRYKDNRIPPMGFAIDQAAARLAQPVWGGLDAPGLYTDAEYAGGYDDVSLTIPTGADAVRVVLSYQTTSREYVEFLRHEIRGEPTTLPADAYVAHSHPFFSGLAAWGETIWSLWLHNVDRPGAAPVEMTRADWGTPPASCEVTAPTLLSAVPGNREVTVTWSDVTATDPSVVGYRLDYDQAGKAQLVAELSSGVTSYTDSELTNDQEVCYRVTALATPCESGPSNVLCAVPNHDSQVRADVTELIVGRLAGKGKSATFEATTAFTVGETVLLRATVVDAASGVPLEGATVELTLSGPEGALLTSSPSDSNGIAEMSWSTSTPRRNGTGGTSPGEYLATVTAVASSTYSWTGTPVSVLFTLQ